MTTINTGKLLLAGLAAGVVLFVTDGILNGVILADQWSAFQKSIGRSAKFSVLRMGIFTMLDIVAGLALAWVYAAIRPRFGPGPATALRAGFITWLLMSIPSGFLLATQSMPARLTLITLGFAFVQYALISLLAGVLYQETDAPVARRASA